MEGTIEYSDGREVRYYDLFDLAETLTPVEFDYRLEDLERGDGEKELRALAHFLLWLDHDIVSVTFPEVGTFEVDQGDFEEGFGREVSS